MDEKLNNASDERSRLLQRSSVAMIVSRGLAQKVESMNDKFTALFGYTIEDIPDVDHWWPLAYPDEAYRGSIRNEWQARVEKAICNGSDIEPMEAIVRCKDGSTRHIEAHLACVGDINLVTLIDLTKRKRAEEALRKSEERLLLAAQAGKMYAYEWDIATDTIIRSPEYVNILGFSDAPKQLTRHQILDRVHSDDRALLIGSVDKVTPANPSNQISYRFLRPDGALIWLETRGRAFFDAHGGLVRMIGMVADITERKLAEEALAKMSRKLIEAQEEERKRIARDVHDDYSQRLAMLAIDVESLTEKIGDLSEGTKQELLDFHRRISELGADMHSLSHQLHSSTLENLGLVAGVKAFCEEFAVTEQVQVEFAPENVPRSIPGEVALCLFRVVQEALRNVKRHSGASKANVRIECSGGNLHLTVYDEGKGFDAGNHPTSSGIGIWSMQERVRLLGGRFELQSHLKQGTRIQAWLPFKVE